jgi:hypothetical protein
MVRQELETQWYHLVNFVGMSSGSASNGDRSSSESILEALNESSDSDDCDKGYVSGEYDVAMKEFEAKLALEELQKKQTTTRQVCVTNKGDDGGQATINPPAPAAKDAHAFGAHDQ